VLALGDAAQAQNAADTLTGYGMIGRWATDCSVPPNKNNFHTIYKVGRNGHVVRTYYNEPNKVYNEYDIASVLRVSDTQFVYKQTSGNDTYEVVIEVNKTRYHVLQSRKVGGDYLVKDGKYKDGSESAWQTKCGK